MEAPVPIVSDDYECPSFKMLLMNCLKWYHNLLWRDAIVIAWTDSACEEKLFSASCIPKVLGLVIYTLFCRCIFFITCLLMFETGSSETPVKCGRFLKTDPRTSCSLPMQGSCNGCIHLYTQVHPLLVYIEAGKSTQELYSPPSCEAAS